MSRFGGTQAIRAGHWRAALAATALVLAAGGAQSLAAPVGHARGTALKTNPAPAVHPSLREWNGRSGQWRLTAGARIVLAPQNASPLRATAATFRNDLRTETGRALAVIDGRPRSGDIFLTLRGAPARIGLEGYRLRIGTVLQIQARSDQGLFYGTQTIEQILKLDPARADVPRGSALDWPEFSVRAQMLDVARHFYPVSYLRSQIRRMAWMKLNVFHLHLTDWDAFRIKVPGFAGLASAQAYSSADIHQLESYAHLYHVLIVPEVDLPAHATAITRYDPSLRFKCSSLDYAPQWSGGANGGWDINITSAHALSFIHQLLRQIIPMFSGPYFDIGGDEYPDDAAKAACPELVAYQHGHGFADPGDVFVNFSNTLDRQVRSFGKTTEMWGWWIANNQTTSIQPNKDIVIDTLPVLAPVLAPAGYKLVVIDFKNLYVTPGSGQAPGEYGYVPVQSLYENYQFAAVPGVLGYKLARWGDNAQPRSVAWTDFFARRPLEVLADRLWGGPRLASAWRFFATVDAVGGPPPSQLTAVPKTAWKLVSVDSQETQTGNGLAVDAFDDDPYTFWESSPSGTAAHPSHEITLNLGAVFRIGGFSYLPPQNGSAQGRVSRYELDLSRDGVHWHRATAGGFADDQTEKTVAFAAAEARFVRFIARADYGGQSTRVAELTLLQAPVSEVQQRG